MVRQKPNPEAWTPNQIVASNLSRARMLRDWTQDQAAEALTPFLGTRLSAASWSAMERSVDGGRIREFTADDLFAFARGFSLPIGFFLTPPFPGEGIGVAAPDGGRRGLEPNELLDVVLGTEESLEEWRNILLSWGAFAGHRVLVHPDGRVEHLGRGAPDVHDRLDHPAAIRAQMLLREQFGDLDAARQVLERITAVLSDLDETAPADTEEDQVTPAPPSRRRPAASRGTVKKTRAAGRDRRPTD